MANVSDDRFYRPKNAPVSPCRTAEDDAEWAYWDAREAEFIADAEAADRIVLADLGITL